MNAGDDCVLFCGQTKRVVANRVQNIFTRHSLEATEDIGCDVSKWVTDMQTCPRWIRKHVKNKKFLATGHTGDVSKWPGRVGCFKSAVFLPMVLPFLLDTGSQRSAISVGGY